MLHVSLILTGSLLVISGISEAQLEGTSDNYDSQNEDETIPINYNTYHRYRQDNETTWPKEKMRNLPRIKKCSAGYFSEECQPCPLGYYKPSGQRKRCARCGSDSGTPDIGATWCTKLCKPGTRLLDAGSKTVRRNCTKCEIGSYQPYSNVDFRCVPCPNNMTTATEGSKSINDCFLNCPSGQQPNGDHTECVLCPEGTYKTVAGPDQCENCTMNRTTVEDGATAANQCKAPCKPGREYNETSGRCDIACEIGTFKDELSSRSKCRPCPEHFTPNRNRAATYCVPNCGPGYEINDNQDNCTACQFGFYKSEDGNFPCQTCPENQLTISEAATDSGECQNFHLCVTQIIQKLESLFRELEPMMTESTSFIDLMTNACSLGSEDIQVGLLEDVVSSFQTCGVVGQINLRDILIGGHLYKKEYYLNVFQIAYNYGGMCKFVLCLPDAVPEIQMSKLSIRYDICQPSDFDCFCRDVHRALATSFHANLLACPALQFHSEFFAVDVDGKDMIGTLLNASNVKTFCGLSNNCVGVDCGSGRCRSLVSGGYQCICMFGYTGDHCQTAQDPEQETVPDPSQQETSSSRPDTLTCQCPECSVDEDVPQLEPLSCPTCPEQQPCPTIPPCPECPQPTAPPPCPTLPTCTECPQPTAPPPCPANTEPPPCQTLPTCTECPKPTEPPPCPTCTEPVPCPSPPPCPECLVQTEPPPCPTHTEPPPCPICSEPLPCPTYAEPSPCPTTIPCPACPVPTEPPPCMTCQEPPPCPTYTEPPPCPPIPSCPECLMPPPCPTTTTCPVCPTQTSPPPCPTMPACPVCPIQTEPPPCPTNTPCPQCPTFPPTTPCPVVEETPRSCMELLERGYIRSSVYTIYIAGLDRDIEVFCDQDMEGGGWIVIQRRKDGSENFYRDWVDYKAGFGSNVGEFWLGLDIIFHLTNLANNELRIDLQDFDNEKRYAKYSKFTVGSEGSGYLLTVDGYSGNAGDSFTYHSGNRFSTKDVDNDVSSSESCANSYKGGWWYGACHASNLNGLYLGGPHESYADGVEWYDWKQHYYSLKVSEMKIRGKSNSPQSCLDHLKRGNIESGVYRIYVVSLGKEIEVYCDQVSDGGGWIVFQRREDGSEDFYRNWQDYKDGFGETGREVWLGLEKLHYLTNSLETELRIDLQDFENEERYAKYSTFKVGAENSGYILTAVGYSGNAGDSFTYHIGNRFSTKDVDNDASSSDSCAVSYKGGWWYGACHASNLNGLYLGGPHESYADGVEWYDWKAHYYSLKFTEMKIREKL